jgi:RimK family alpha-L-glutamate ligase
VRFGLIACRSTPTNDALAAVELGDARWELLTPQQAVDVLRRGDVALGRLDVLPTLDGVDDGLWALGALAARGVVVLNEASVLLAAHDKLLTARLLRRRGIPHPQTWHVRAERPAPRWGRSVVVKPRYGSWGLEVHRCDDPQELQTVIARARGSAWYQRHGAIVQELVPPQGYDLRIVVAGGQVLGAAFRIAAPGEWRTNVALGGVRREVEEPPREAASLALEAAAAIGASLVGVDLLPDSRGGWVVAELNGAVEFTHEYATWHDVFMETASALVRDGVGRVGIDALETAELA